MVDITDLKSVGLHALAGSSPAAATMIFLGKVARKIFIENLRLKEFRNYKDLDIYFDEGINIITGSNGIGKTNMVEAISLHLPGKGIRSERITNFDNICQEDDFKILWQLHSRVMTKTGRKEFEFTRSGNFEVVKAERVIKIDGKVSKGKKILADLVSIIWLTPKMDQLFLSPTNERRKFFDKIALNYNSQHSENLNRFEELSRERIKLLYEHYKDELWLSTIEKNMAELATAIYFTRRDALGYINSSMSYLNDNFVRASVSLEGDFENLMSNQSATTAEGEYCQMLRINRNCDRDSEKTLISPLRSDFQVIYLAKNLPASLCSTGEQKLLLISVILAEVYSRKHWFNIKPIIILDDITSHLDKNFREILLEEICKIDCQTFITATNIQDFQNIMEKSFHIDLNVINLQNLSSLRNA